MKVLRYIALIIFAGLGATVSDSTVFAAARPESKELREDNWVTQQQARDTKKRQKIADWFRLHEVLRSANTTAEAIATGVPSHVASIKPTE